MLWFFLTSGLFLGWSIGANDSANLFGTAVGTRMLKFKIAAAIASVFLISGAVIDGGGVTHTLGLLGDVNAIAGSFTVAFSAAVAVTILIKKGLPVSVSQAIIGSIIGWNLFTASPTDISSLISIIIVWIINPILACAFSYLIYKFLKHALLKFQIHILELDIYTRAGLIIAAALGAYSLGANNISKVVGVFVTSSPFKDIQITTEISISAIKQLFFVGALSMVLGIYTYSHRTIHTVGREISRLSPVSAFSTILGSTVVLFMFSSQELSKLLNSAGLPSLPLVPISITQAMIGAVAGIGFVRGVNTINYKLVGKIITGWLITPFAACLFSFVFLFIVQNVFQQKVVHFLSFEITVPVVTELQKENLPAGVISKLEGQTFSSQAEFRQVLNQNGISSESDLFKIFDIAKIEIFKFDSNYAKQIMNPGYFTLPQIEAVKKLHLNSFTHKWQVKDQLILLSESWRKKPNMTENEIYNKELDEKLNFILNAFKIKEPY